METTNKKAAKKEGSDTKRLVIHLAVIFALAVVGVVGAHFGLILLTRHNARCTVPQLKGLIYPEAEYITKDSDLNIIINDSLYVPMYEGGMVLDQLPSAGVEVKPGRTIYVTINAFGKKRVRVPYVAGRSLRQAKNMLEVAGLQIEKLVYKPDMATNYVLAEYLGDEQIAQSSAVDAVVGSGVTLHVGVNKDEWSTSMPQLIGMTLPQAKSRLWELGLNVGKITLPSDATTLNRDRARVYSQSVFRGTDVSLGTSVSLSLTLDDERVEQLLVDIEKTNRLAEIAKQKELDSLANAKSVE